MPSPWSQTGRSTPRKSRFYIRPTVRSRIELPRSVATIQDLLDMRQVRFFYYINILFYYNIPHLRDQDGDRTRSYCSHLGRRGTVLIYGAATRTESVQTVYRIHARRPTFDRHDVSRRRTRILFTLGDEGAGLECHPLKRFRPAAIAWVATGTAHLEEACLTMRSSSQAKVAQTDGSRTNRHPPIGEDRSTRKAARLPRIQPRLKRRWKSVSTQQAVAVERSLVQPSPRPD